MPILNNAIPLSLYIHLPWCIRKCPYCDFNSHVVKDSLAESIYIQALLQNLAKYVPLIADRPLQSIFFGGGTPSLFSGPGIATILEGVQACLPFASDIEITLEANPGASDQAKFAAYRAAGVNRLSIGVQSFHNAHLQTLGRIHHSESALQAITAAKAAGFNNFNIDIMYGLPDQTIEQALADIRQALDQAPTHFSWYQLTIEPNTVFYAHPPTLPQDDYLYDMQQAGQALIHQHAFQQYEVSAYALSEKQCIHNLNYWQFGDYLGIGAGAHSKLTLKDGSVQRFAQVKQPKDFLNPTIREKDHAKSVDTSALIFEFMLNALRLQSGFSINLFESRTGLPFQVLESYLTKAQAKGLLTIASDSIRPTALGARFLNDTVGLFL